MHYYRGIAAFSDFRLDKKLVSLKQAISDIDSLQTEYIHFVQADETLTDREEQHLQSLLQYGQRIPPVDSNHLLLVIPRPGTISPWSSKATDIARNCGLHKIQRVERGVIWHISLPQTCRFTDDVIAAIKPLVHDRMTEAVFHSIDDAAVLFRSTEPAALATIDILAGGTEALQDVNKSMGLALTEPEIEYLVQSFNDLGRNPTDVELMMFAQANSEHCRHKIFNAEWTINGVRKEHSLFDMIRQTHQRNPGLVLSAYRDNAAVTTGYSASRFYALANDHCYTYSKEDVHILMKVETHNHPTAISPYPGAATGSGGEIRDEAATGRGAKPKAGLTGFSVSNLNIPGCPQPWEKDHGKPDRIVSALTVMLDGPIGGAAFNNEFGRPALSGYFRTFEQTDHQQRVRGYHKPIMLAGGYGMVRAMHIHKDVIPPGARIVVLGGPAMLIGLGGGAASSMASGQSDAALDFASVQRDNAEMQRRCQEVIDACWSLGSDNPVISIHDVGAGGLSNALPELVSAAGRGARFDLRKIPNAEPGMSPLEIWCNEAQERYVLALAPEAVKLFEEFCRRERAPFAVIGEATGDGQLKLHDELFHNDPIDIPMSVLLGELPRMQRSVETGEHRRRPLELEHAGLAETINRILHLPAVADKRFLITIADRSISGLTARDQMVGPWQTPVADCAITASAINAYVGEAMAIGERSPLSLIDGPASAHMAIAEAITNIAAARIINLGDISLSANWMAACGQDDEDAGLYATVQATSEFCQALGIAIPVGKDSLSMNTVWEEAGHEKQVTAPLSLIVSGFAPVADIRQQLTPLLHNDSDDTVLLLLDLGYGRDRLGGSALAQVYNQIGETAPDISDPDDLKSFFRGIQIMNEMGVLLAYHDRSDGGLFITLCEMAFAARCGLDITLADGVDPLSRLFSEEAGAVIQVRRSDVETVRKVFQQAGWRDHIYPVARLNNEKIIRIQQKEDIVFSDSLQNLHRQWSETSFHMQSLRDNPDCAQQEFDSLLDADDPGLFLECNFEVSVPAIGTGAKPEIAILREQGVNGQVEMAAAFHRAGFECIDVHMSDLVGGKVSLDSFKGIAACGGFSYGDVLGAGGGWAKSILYNPALKKEFETFFRREDTFGLGVCNGCQMFSHLRELIPGTGHWPRFVRNLSEQFESRLVMVEIMPSPSILLRGMEGAKLPIVVAHGEGQTCFNEADTAEKLLPVLRYIDNYGSPAEKYPANPNGSSDGLNGFTNQDGRFTIMMPHPERVFLKKQFSWLDPRWVAEDGPWMQVFINARKWVDE